MSLSRNTAYFSGLAALGMWLVWAGCTDEDTSRPVSIAPTASDILCDGRDEPVFVVFAQYSMFGSGDRTAGDTIVFDGDCRFQWGSRTGSVTEAELQAFVEQVWPQAVRSPGLSTRKDDGAQWLYGFAWRGGTVACEWPCSRAWDASIAVAREMSHHVLWQRFEPAEGPWFAESYIVNDYLASPSSVPVELAPGSAFAAHAIDLQERGAATCFSDAYELTQASDIAIAEAALDIGPDDWQQGWSRSFVAHDPATDRFIRVAVRVGTPWDDDRGVLSWGDLPLLDDCGGLSASGRALAR